LFSPALSLAEILYVKSDKTKLFTEESARSRVFQKIRAGTPVKAIVGHKQFYRAALASGKRGWLFKFKLTSKDPSTRGRQSCFIDILAGRPSVSARESNSGSSIRGLSPASATYAKNKRLCFTAAQAVSDILFTHGLDQDLEYEADRMGMEYANRKGFNPAGLKEFIRILDLHSTESSSIFFSIHLSQKDRYRNLVSGLTHYDDTRINPDLSQR